MSYTPFNAPLLSSLLGDKEIAAHFSVRADLDAMVRFEVALAQAEAETGVISPAAAQAIESGADTFEPDMMKLNAATARDGMAVPDLIGQFRDALPDDHKTSLHFGSTSQDVADTALVLRLKQVNEVLSNRLGEVIKKLDGLTARFGANRMMGQTRMQTALPIPVSHRLDQWKRPLVRHHMLLPEINYQLLCVQFGGSVGTLDKLGDKGDETRRLLSEKLDLRDPGCCRHTDRTGIVDYGQWLALVTGSLGKLGRDVCLMAQSETRTLSFEGAGTSSAMAHKQNPIKAESLVALAQFNAGLAGTLHQAMVHEQERSGAMWTLEWMLIPQLCVATGAALRNAAAFLDSITAMGDTPQ